MTSDFEAYATPAAAPLLNDRQPARRATVLSLTGLGASVLIAVLTVIPAAFAVGGPGPTFDTLGTKDGVALVLERLTN